jgi:hypothetical protein
MLLLAVARSSSELAAEVAHDVQRLAQLQLQLAQQEAKELAARDGTAVGLMAVGALLLALGTLVGVPVMIVVWIPNHVVVAAIWIGAYWVVGSLLALVGFAVLRPKPRHLRGSRRDLLGVLLPRSRQSFQETRDWLRRQINSNAR